MSSEPILEIVSTKFENTLKTGRTLGANLRGGEVIELVGDLGSGKTAFTRGVAEGIDTQDRVQSPSFTISREYRGKGSNDKPITIHHFDFHRLQDAGILEQEISETMLDKTAVIVTEWGSPVAKVLPQNRLRIEFIVSSENSRLLKFYGPAQTYTYLLKGLE